MKRVLFFITAFLMLCGVAQAEIYTFPVNPPRELNFMNKEDIFRVRNEMIEAYPIFYQGDYRAEDSSVFRQIENGKPWWGLKGLLCYGPGKLSIEGEADESRFIDNPFLLISVEEGFALPFMTEKGDCPLSYPEPTSITFDSDTMTFTVEYSISNHDETIEYLTRKNHIRFRNMRQYAFHGRNALDFGVPYVYATEVNNLHFLNGKNVSNTLYRFRDFIHVGGSCGYPGGCNNGSPYQPETEFQIDSYPASITFKLWRKQPQSTDEPADLTYQVNIN